MPARWRAPSGSDQRVRVRVAVPASVANLGPGFDILALALQLQNDIRAEQRPGALTHRSGSRRTRRRCATPSTTSSRVPTRKPAPSSASRLHGVHFTLRESDPDRPRYGIERGRGARRCARRDGVAPGAVGRGRRARPRRGARGPSRQRRRGAARRSRHLRSGRACGADGRVATSSARCCSSPTRRSRPPSRARSCPTEFSREDAIFNASRCALLVRALAIGDHAGLARRDAGSLAPGRAIRADARVAGRSSTRRTRAGASGAALAGAGPSVIALTPLDTGADRRRDGRRGGERRRCRADDGAVAAQLRHPRGRLAVTRVVQKYGGSSVATPIKLRRVARRIRESLDAGMRGRCGGERHGRHHR